MKTGDGDGDGDGDGASKSMIRIQWKISHSLKRIKLYVNISYPFQYFCCHSISFVLILP